MRLNLTPLEIRILGSLMEKELATPENYPLSLNALASACNQKSNRDPVLSLSEPELLQGLAGLGNKGLARRTATGGRVDKYVHSVTDRLHLEAPTRAVLAELMLRGPQTASELRNRAERMAEASDLDAILQQLQQYGPPLIMLLPRQPGRKEPRYAQLFGGAPELPEEEELPEYEPREPREPRAARMTASREKLGAIGEEIVALRSELAELRQSVDQVVGSLR